MVLLLHCLIPLVHLAGDIANAASESPNGERRGEH